LEDVDGGGELLRLDVREGANRLGGLVHNHLALVTQRRFEEGVSTTCEGAPVHEGAGRATLADLVGKEFGGIPNEEDEREGGLERVALAELGDELLHPETIVFFYLV